METFPNQKRFRFWDRPAHCYCTARGKDGSSGHSDSIVAVVYMAGDARRERPYPVCENHVGCYAEYSWRYTIEEVY